MILSALQPVCRDNNSIAFAERDAKLMLTLKKIGIKVEAIAVHKTIQYEEMITKIDQYDQIMVKELP